MARTAHWEDTTRYAVWESATGKVPFTISGGIGPVVIDAPDAEATAAIEELIAAGCPVVRSNEELLSLARTARGRPVWELAGSSQIGLWQDQWGTIWLKAHGRDPVSGAEHLSKYEALGLAEQLLALSKSAPR